MIAPHYNTDLNAWITVNATTGEWVLVFGPIKHDVADFDGELCAYSEEWMARRACYLHNAPLAEVDE